MNVAVGVTPMETRREVVLRLADLAEDLGYSAFTVAEGWGYDAGVLLAEIATRTSRIELGTGVLNVWGRTPATIAMLATSLAEASADRFETVRAAFNAAAVTTIAVLGGAHSYARFDWLVVSRRSSLDVCDAGGSSGRSTQRRRRPCRREVGRVGSADDQNTIRDLDRGGLGSRGAGSGVHHRIGWPLVVRNFGWSHRQRILGVGVQRPSDAGRWPYRRERRGWLRVGADDPVRG